MLGLYHGVHLVVGVDSTRTRITEAYRGLLGIVHVLWAIPMQLLRRSAWSVLYASRSATIRDSMMPSKGLRKLWSWTINSSDTGHDCWSYKYSYAKA